MRNEDFKVGDLVKVTFDDNKQFSEMLTLYRMGILSSNDMRARTVMSNAKLGTVISKNRSSIEPQDRYIVVLSDGTYWHMHPDDITKAI